MSACKLKSPAHPNKYDADNMPGLSPLYGKLSDIIGRKPILFTCIGLFLFGSAMCGAAQNFIWLALCRGVQGIGGGGMIQMTSIAISDISECQHLRNLQIAY